MIQNNKIIPQSSWNNFVPSPAEGSNSVWLPQLFVRGPQVWVHIIFFYEFFKTNHYEMIPCFENTLYYRVIYFWVEILAIILKGQKNSISTSVEVPRSDPNRRSSMLMLALLGWTMEIRRWSSVDDDPTTTRLQLRPCPVQSLPIYSVKNNLLGEYKGF